MPTVGLPLGAKQSRKVALFEKGFRPFFLLSAAFALLIVPTWILVYGGQVFLGAYLTPIYWHAHEMVFGFSAAVIAGFLLTAASNWTQRETATGWRLGLLCLAWLAGRAALLFAATLPPGLVVALNLSFLPALAFTLARPLLAAQNRRNYGFIALLGALWLAQLGVHLGALGIAPSWQRTGAVVGVDLVILVILLVGGRVIPFFTRNATQAAGIESAPRLDRAALAAVAVLTALDALELTGAIVAIVAGASACLAAARAWRWGAQHTRREPLLWVLHAGYAFVPFGLGLRALAALELITTSAAQHALTTGAIGTLTLGMMARVSLGHTGRPLEAGALLGAAFALMIGAALLRVVGALVAGGATTPALHASATLWTAAFAVYLIRLGPALLAPRPDGRPG